MFEHETTDELYRLQELYLDQLTRRDSTWKGAYYFGGLLSAMGGAYLVVLNGIDAFNAFLLLVGVPAIWMWKRDNRQQALVNSLYEEVNAELARRQGDPLLRR